MPTASASPRKAPREQSVTPMISDIEWEMALLRATTETRPVGQHKHLAILRIQADMHRHLGIWVSTPEIWSKLSDLYDLDALDERASSSSVSLPTTPQTLSPILKRDPYDPNSKPQPSSSSPTKSTSTPAVTKPKRNNQYTKNRPKPEPEPETEDTPHSNALENAGTSKSAKVINSGHFGTTFDLPILRSKKRGKRSGSGSAAGMGTGLGLSGMKKDEDDEDVEEEEGEEGGGLVDDEEHVEDSDSWVKLIYPRAEPEKGEEVEGDERWDEQKQVWVQKWIEDNEDDVKVGNKGKKEVKARSTTTYGKVKGEPAGRSKKGRDSSNTRGRKESSPLSEEEDEDKEEEGDEEDADEEEEGEGEEEEEEEEDEEEEDEDAKEKEASKIGRGKGWRKGMTTKSKRKRASLGSTVEKVEEESEEASVSPKKRPDKRTRRR